MTLRYHTNLQKALEVILWIAERRPGVGFHKTLKLLFFADKYHLNHYGRPVVGDVYYAREYGPVAQMTYDILKFDPLALEGLDDEELPIEVRGRHDIHAKRPPNRSLFSETDIEALEFAYEKYGNLGFAALTRLTHAEPSYIKADGWIMNYADFLDDTEDRDEKIADITETASRVVL